MNRRLVGLLAALCLTSACEEEPNRGIQPLPRPPGMAATPPPQTTRPAKAPPPEDPSRVLLRWNLREPLAFTVTTTSSGPGSGSGSAPASGKPAPPARGKKRKAAAPAPAPAAAPASTGPQTLTFVLHTGPNGQPAFHVFPQPEGAADQGAMSERGFVLDGLSGQMRDLAVLVLELPLERVGKDARWQVATTLVDTAALRGFTQKSSNQKNEVRLVALTPGDGGEQVATLEYDIARDISGQVRTTEEAPAEKAGAEPPPVRAKKKVTMARGRGALLARPGVPVSAEVRVRGRGEFLVKAGHWRSWEGTLSTRTTGAPLAELAQGERVLRLTPVEPVPPELLGRLAPK